MCSATRRASCRTARSSAPRWPARWRAAPRVLLLDDPLRNVDAKLRFEMRLELPRLLRQSGSTVLYVTQDYKEAMALGDRIAVLRRRPLRAGRRRPTRSIASRRPSRSRACSAIRPST